MGFRGGSESRKNLALILVVFLLISFILPVFHWTFASPVFHDSAFGNGKFSTVVTHQEQTHSSVCPVCRFYRLSVKFFIFLGLTGCISQHLSLGRKNFYNETYFSTLRVFQLRNRSPPVPSLL